MLNIYCFHWESAAGSHIFLGIALMKWERAVILGGISKMNILKSMLNHKRCKTPRSFVFPGTFWWSTEVGDTPAAPELQYLHQST